MQFKLSWAHWTAPTPAAIKKIGNALVAASSFGSVPAGIYGGIYIGGAIVAAGIIGKLILGFYTDTDVASKTSTNSSTNTTK